jgi:hypothetical protein
MDGERGPAAHVTVAEHPYPLNQWPEVMVPAT